MFDIMFARVFFFFQAEDGIRDYKVTGVQTCALPISMIAAGVYLLFSADRPEQTVRNLWTHGGFFPNGFSGLVMAFAFIMFAFGGVEMLGFAAAETDQPRTVIPKAVNQLIYRVLVFYIG